MNVMEIIYCTFIIISLKYVLIKSLVVSSTRNETGLKLGWVFRWVYRKKPAGFFWVSTRVSTVIAIANTGEKLQ